MVLLWAATAQITPSYIWLAMRAYPICTTAALMTDVQQKLLSLQEVASSLQNA
jgi:hypothetical protein